MSFLLNIFGNIKNIAMALGSVFLGGYIMTQKYKAAKAEDKLKDIESKIAKTNVVIAKTKAKAKAKAVKAETTAEVEVLKDLKKESKKIQKEMEVIEKNIETNIKEQKTKKVQSRTRSESFEVEV